MKRCYCDFCGIEGATETSIELKHDRIVHTHAYAVTLDLCEECHDRLEERIKQLMVKRKL